MFIEKREMYKIIKYALSDCMYIITPCHLAYGKNVTIITITYTSNSKLRLDVYLLRISILHFTA